MGEESRLRVEQMKKVNEERMRIADEERRIEVEKQKRIELERSKFLEQKKLELQRKEEVQKVEFRQNQEEHVKREKIRRNDENKKIERKLQENVASQEESKKKVSGGDCPSFGVHYQPHVDPEITYNVKSWSACSNLCRFRRACQFWSWVDENGGRWAFKCTTMTNIPNITMTENNFVSGGRDCGYIEDCCRGRFMVQA